ncbi:hypothetical protein ACJMK2_012671 [Sinanodonta woodiana]|uniref:Uncharacterized protein n=1 Tax=Sinanodonta woodiana TaxID=1069815 RepID=A0ABD3VC04_SINWO
MNILKIVLNMAVTTINILKIVLNMAVTTMNILKIVLNMAVTTMNILKIALNMAVTTMNILKIVLNMAVTTMNILKIVLNMAVTTMNIENSTEYGCHNNEHIESLSHRWIIISMWNIYQKSSNAYKFWLNENGSNCTSKMIATVAYFIENLISQKYQKRMKT